MITSMQSFLTSTTPTSSLIWTSLSHAFDRQLKTLKVSSFTATLKEVIGALMTIIGYSLNDTIIIFDRIREDIRVHRKLTFREVIRHALNVTLSRTLMTSGTTVLVLIALLVLGGSAVFTFSFIMLVGVIVGTLSSLFIASPVMLFFHNREQAQHATQTTEVLAK